MKNRVLEKLIYEFEHHIKNELYSICQFKLASRSNQVEGNTMTEEDTAMLFDTQQIPSNSYKAKEIEEAQGHFLMFNAMLKTIDKPISEDIIKSYHKAMTEGIFEFKANGGVPGEYKTRNNIAGTTETVEPNKVHEELTKLLNEYNSKKSITLNDIAYFHCKYEKIHPFQDYNGRTGRMIVFRESLKYLTPVVISVSDRKEYIYALAYAQNNNFNVEKLETKFKEWQDSFYKEIEKYI